MLAMVFTMSVVIRLGVCQRLFDRFLIVEGATLSTTSVFDLWALEALLFDCVRQLALAALDDDLHLNRLPLSKGRAQYLNSVFGVIS